jgi:hypothetical protein
MRSWSRRRRSNKAASVNCAWWRLHRLHQREDAASTSVLVDFLVALYSHVYRVAAYTALRRGVEVVPS